jgi:hypothetical protein
MKYEIVCFTRLGFEILHSEGIDAAAKVTYLAYEPDGWYTAATGVKSEWLVPLANPGMYR